METEGSLPH